MTWLSRSRHGLPLLLAFFLGVAVTVAMTGVVAPYPTVGPPSGQAIPAALASPQLPASALLALLISAHPERELIAIRPAGQYVRWGVLMLLVLSAASFLVARSMLDQPVLVASLRNLIGLVGLGACLMRLATPFFAVAGPVMYCTVVFCLGDRVDPGLWDWPLAPGRSTGAACVAGTLLILGFMFGFGRGALRNQIRRHDEAHTAT